MRDELGGMGDEDPEMAELAKAAADLGKFISVTGI
jgi:hypothetical protein